MSLAAGRVEAGIPVRGPALRKNARGGRGGEDRAVPVVRDQPVQVPGLRDRLQRSHLLRGLVLQPARWRGKPDQGGEQRCRAGGAPLRPLRWERQSFPVGDAGLQPELLADAVQPRTAGDATALQHTTLATARLRFLFVAAKIWRHAGRTGVSYSAHYEEKGVFERLMDRLRRIAPRGQGYAPVMLPALR